MYSIPGSFPTFSRHPGLGFHIRSPAGRVDFVSRPSCRKMRKSVGWRERDRRREYEIKSKCTECPSGLVAGMSRLQVVPSSEVMGLSGILKVCSDICLGGEGCRVTKLYGETLGRWTVLYALISVTREATSTYSSMRRFSPEYQILYTQHPG